MKLPQTFVSDRNLEEKTKNLKDGIIRTGSGDVPQNIDSIEDAIKYASNSIIPAYGYDKRKRIQETELTLKEIMLRGILVGRLDLTDENPIHYQGIYFNKDTSDKHQNEFKIKINLLSDPAKIDKEIMLSLANYVKQIVYANKNQAWHLIGPVADEFSRMPEICATVNVDTPKEILWAFETFKEFNPVIHGGALRDLYLGIERTADIDVQLTTKGWWSERKLYSLVHKVMDEVYSAKKGVKTEDSYRGTRTVEAAYYRAKKSGIDYDLAGEVFTRYLSTEQIMMKKPGELIMWKLAKTDLDNKQFRMINSNKVPARIGEKMLKLKNLGLEFLPENPSDLSKKLAPEIISGRKATSSYNPATGSYYY